MSGSGRVLPIDDRPDPTHTGHSSKGAALMLSRSRKRRYEARITQISAHPQPCNFSCMNQGTIDDGVRVTGFIECEKQIGPAQGNGLSTLLTDAAHRRIFDISSLVFGRFSDDSHGDIVSCALPNSSPGTMTTSKPASPYSLDSMTARVRGSRPGWAIGGEDDVSSLIKFRCRVATHSGPVCRGTGAGRK
jgi:hypothetical protein